MIQKHTLLRLIGILILMGIPSISSAQTAPPIKAGTWQLDSKSFRAGSSNGLALDTDGLRTTAGSSGTFHSLPIQTEFEFIALGVTWATPLPAAASTDIAIRTRYDESEWSEWATLDVDGQDRPDFAAATGTELHFARGEWFQLRVTVQDASFAAGSLLKNLTVTYLDTRAGPTTQQLAQPSGSSTPAIISRSQWGADESYRFDDSGDEVWTPEYQTPVKVIVHHTATTNDIPDPPATVRAIYYYHAVTRGWGDIGYNYLIDPEGRIYEGRFGGEIDHELVIGGHAHRYNPGSIGIAILGNFQPGSDEPAIPLPAASESALTDLIAHKANRYGIHPLEEGYFIDGVFKNVSGHRDVGARYGPTSCPGDYAYARLDAVRANAWDQIQTLAPEVYFRVPAVSATLTETTSIEPIVSPTISHIELFVDSQSVATDDSEPFSVPLDSNSLSPGEHAITLVGRTPDGRTGQYSDTVTVPAPPTATPTPSPMPALAAQSRLYVPVILADGTIVTPTPSPTATATPTQTAIACTNLLDNGDMEQDAGWQLTTDDDYNWTSRAYYAAVAHAGSRSMFVGLQAGETSDIPRWSSGRQTVTLPAQGNTILSLWYKPESQTAPDSSDRQYIFLYDDAGNELARFLDTNIDSDVWQYLEADVSSYAGQTVEVYVGVKNDGAGGTARMYVDDVTICTQ